MTATVSGGMSTRGSVIETKLAVDKRIMDVNYFGAVALTKALLPLFKTQGHGHIVVVSSLQGKMSIPFRAACNPRQLCQNAVTDVTRQMPPASLRCMDTSTP